MKIKFLIDYIGRETAMKEYKKGDELELSQQPALEVINFEIAEEVVDNSFFKTTSGINGISLTPLGSHASGPFISQDIKPKPKVKNVKNPQ